MKFTDKITHWYSINKRNLPWRNTKNPYAIWLSEIIMQQTQIAQGQPYYLKFISKYPEIKQLAAANLEEVLKLWQGLGYYSRARNLHDTANYVSGQLDGQFPNTYSEIIKLKGIGDYTASAIASICFNEPHAVVDGNVYRVLARYFGIGTPINSSVGQNEFKLLAQKLIDTRDPGDYNQAIMEFGALQCKPKSPNCSVCVLNANCVAFKTDAVANLPVKLKKTKVKARVFNYIVPIFNDGTTLLTRREADDIWKLLYEFPLLETQKKATETQIQDFVKAYFKMSENLFDLSSHNKKAILHKLTHQHIHTYFWKVDLPFELPNSISASRIRHFAVPTLISNFIENDLDKLLFKSV